MHVCVCEKVYACAHVLVAMCRIYARYMCHVCMFACMHVSECVSVCLYIINNWVAGGGGWIGVYVVR